MAIDILPLTKSDIPDAVVCIQKAFADDPYFRWMFDDPATFNPQRNAASITAHFLHGLNCNAPIYVAKYRPTPTDKHPAVPALASPIVGVCWWLPPHPPAQPPSWSTWTQDWLLSFRQLLSNLRFWGRGGLNLRRYWIWKDLQARTHADLWTHPRGYYFCNVIAVREGLRGMGVGRKLVEVVTGRADAEGVPCYLESSKGEPNLVIYEKMGFRLVREIECVDGWDACKLYCMVREPRVKA
ncbi:GNAT family N-acetyltransferase [Aspergillus clavatus NRRL 1]|uniref:Acetyltransferase, GNAT family family n=1 Tax=Aspergillus clavatus (strain ATCC 1007 / CBS 513.65 / DSM 816 / NCTC 3887 / NRRL 1 / QM 1276 / 107) TaxID=344612 RepID=A1CHQ5_ASPCL|nr:acetyltransferase, GNAT family [Aspergillus clavatus NRRL 1]EAW10410.1 acetyltransferase, GNAT family family [Aspergillus clavatus NRRL 1]